MTRVKSLPEPEAGYQHRIHRSRKARQKEWVRRKEGKRMRIELLERFDKRHPPE